MLLNDQIFYYIKIFKLTTVESLLPPGMYYTVFLKQTNLLVFKLNTVCTPFEGEKIINTTLKLRTGPLHDI